MKGGKGQIKQIIPGKKIKMHHQKTTASIFNWF